MNARKHFKKICIHKYWVAHYCFKVGLYWRGIIHDLSKFSPVEFFESVKYYQGNRSPIDACKEVNGWSKAWQHHKRHNLHHYEVWTDNFDSGCTAIPMPRKYALEMLCDYLGAARAYNGKSFNYKDEYKWWLNKKSHGIKMHEKTQNFIEQSISCLVYSGDKAFNVIRTKEWFDACYHIKEENTENERLHNQY